EFRRVLFRSRLEGGTDGENGRCGGPFGPRGGSAAVEARRRCIRRRADGNPVPRRRSPSPGIGPGGAPFRRAGSVVCRPGGEGGGPAAEGGRRKGRRGVCLRLLSRTG